MHVSALSLLPGRGHRAVTTALDLRGCRLGAGDALLLAGVLSNSNGGLRRLLLGENRLCGVWSEGAVQFGRFSPRGVAALLRAAAAGGAVEELRLGGNVLCGVALHGAGAHVARQAASDAQRAVAERRAEAMGRYARAHDAPAPLDAVANEGRVSDGSSYARGFGGKKAAVAGADYEPQLLHATLRCLTRRGSRLATLDLSANALFGVGRFGAGSLRSGAVLAVAALLEGDHTAMTAALRPPPEVRRRRDKAGAARAAAALAVARAQLDPHSQLHSHHSDSAALALPLSHQTRPRGQFIYVRIPNFKLWRIWEQGN